MLEKNKLKNNTFQRKEHFKKVIEQLYQRLGRRI